MATFTFVHVVISLVGIFSGGVVVYGLVTAKRLECLRLDRAAFPESIGPNSDSSDAVRAAIRAHTAYLFSAFRPAWLCCGDQVSQRATPHRLIGRLRSFEQRALGMLA